MSDSLEDKKQGNGADLETNLRSYETIDIEHVPVRDDPRNWSRTRKVRTFDKENMRLELIITLQNLILAIVASAAMIATLGANIYNRAF